MSEWKEVTIEELCDVTRGASPRPIHDFLRDDVGVPWVKIADAKVESGLRYIEETKQYIRPEGVSKSRSVKVGDFILSNSATPGVPRIMSIDACVHDGWLILRNFDGVSKWFLYYAFCAHRGRLLLQANGSVFSNLKTATVKAFPIMLPALEEQEAIAEVLSSLDDKIDLLKRQNKTLEGMAEALFRQWFIEEAQDDWEEVSLGDVFEEIEAGRRPKGGVGMYTEGVPSIGAESVKQIGVHEFGKEKFVPQEFFESMTRGIVKHHDILVYKDGGVPGEFKPHFTMVGFGFPHDKMCINEHVFRCHSKTPFLRAYSFCYLNSSRCRYELEERGTGAAIPGLNSTEFSTCPISLPDKELLEQFESLAGDWFDRILRNAVEARALEKLRDTLLPKLMSGEVRVKLD